MVCHRDLIRRRTATGVFQGVIRCLPRWRRERAVARGKTNPPVTSARRITLLSQQQTVTDVACGEVLAMLGVVVVVGLQ